MELLIIEDERLIAQTIADLLETQGDRGTIALDGPTGLRAGLEQRWDAIILDVMLPGMDGFQVLRELRGRGVRTPVLMLTARIQLDDRVTGLDSGADYYLTKPFEAKELLACVRMLTRRREESAPAVLSFGDLRLELSSCLLCCGERSVRLSRKEFEIMGLLLERQGQNVSKDAILQKVWGTGESADGGSVEVYISFLRKKLQHLGSRCAIRTQRTLGYRLEAEK
ncbi:MAG: response regulator transcription factor [Clostridiales bacterium]|nr:response regulator transcription factor [Clostridiales bacterium]